MSNKGSKISGNTNSKDNIVQASTPVNRIAQNNLLIWLDGSIDEENDAVCRNTITQLQSIVKIIKTFTGSDKCVEFIKTMNNEKAYMIISGSLGQHTVPRIHSMSQVDSIFIFCGDRKKHEQWTKEWSKIKGVYTDIVPICKALKELVQEVDASNDASSIKLNQLDASFMYKKILTEILLTIEFNQNHFKEFIEYCRKQFAENASQMNNLNKFENDYRKQSPIWWYTYECFLCSMLDRSLRLMDVDIIIRMGFFIHDLHFQIEELHKKQFGGNHSAKNFTVYRGDRLSKADFEQILKNKGGLSSFNEFLLTSRDREIALKCVRATMTNPEMVGVLFVMAIDPSISTVPFAFIKNMGYYKNEDDEILFSMHTVFRICQIEPLDESHRLFQVNLKQTGDEDDQLRALTDHIREEISTISNGWYKLGSLLLRLGQYNKALQIYENLLEKTDNIQEKADIYYQLGSIKVNLGEYGEALKFYDKMLEIRQKCLPPNHPNLASSFKSIGITYYNMGDYSKALLYYEKTLDIQQNTLPPNHPNLASSFNSIGRTYYNMRDYSKALQFHEKALKIQQQSLPPNHPDLASSFNDIGSVYCNMNDYSKALSYFEKALDIQQRSLPPDHPSLQKSKENIENMKKKL